jgi:hypothetical protein
MLGVMRTSASHARALVAGIMALLSAVPVTDHKRHWQTGTLVDAGIKHKTFAGGASGTRPPFGSGSLPTPNATPEVGTYVIETDELRLELEGVAPISASTLDAELTVGHVVTFAIEKSTVYIRLADGHEQRLRVVKKLAKKR